MEIPYAYTVHYKNTGFMSHHVTNNSAETVFEFFFSLLFHEGKKIVRLIIQWQDNQSRIPSIRSETHFAIKKAYRTADLLAHFASILLFGL